MTRRYAPFLLLLLIAAGGCTTSVIPPTRPPVPATVYITDYGRHSSLVLPTSNDRSVEYSFGDWEWFAQGHKDSSGALHALLFSGASALGRRELSLPASASDEQIATLLGAKHVEHVEVARERSDALIQKLDEIHKAHRDTVIFNEKTHPWFVKYKDGYNLCHNCNHATAQWLRDLGCRTHGSAMFSKFRVEPQR